MKKFIFALLLVAISAAASFAQVPQSNHVVVVMEENHSYGSVIGNTSMPYLNGLANQYGLATQYYANTHPSIGNYFMLTTGQIITNNDGYMTTVTADNIVRHMLTAGKTWKSYAENLPSVGYTGGDVYPYIRHHNPLSYFSDVVNSSEKNNLVPFGQFATDLANGQLPNFSFIDPNQLNDGHDGTLGAADTWLKDHLGPLLANPQFQQDGILIITFDESYSTDTAYGGGRVATVVVSPALGKKGYKSTALYQEQNMGKTIYEALGLANTGYPGAISSATPMSDFFGTSSTTSGGTTTTGGTTTSSGGCTASTVGVHICSPSAGTSYGSPVTVNAAAMGSTSITALAVYVDNTLATKVSGASINAGINMSAGTHNVVVQAWSSSGTVYKSSVSTTVGSGSTTSGGTTTTSGGTATGTGGTISGSSGCTLSTTVNTVTICSPVNNGTSTASVNVSAGTTSSSAVTLMQVYVDGTKKYEVGTPSLNTNLSMAAGTHRITVQAYNSAGTIFKSTVYTTVP